MTGGIGWWSTTKLVAARDLRAEWHSRVVAFQVLPFGLVGLMLAAFALDADPRTLERAGPGIFWVVALFAAVVATQNHFANEVDPSVLDGYRMSALHPSGVFLGKTVAMFVLQLSTEAVLFCVLVAWFRPGFGPGLEPWGIVVGAGVTATAAICAASCLYGLLAAHTRAGAAMLGILVLPALAPVLLGASRAFDAAAGRGSDGWSWVALMAVFAVSYALLGAATYGPLMEDS